MDRDLIIPFSDYELEEDYDMHLFDQLNQMESIPMANDPHLFDLLEEQDPYPYPPPYYDPMDDVFLEEVTIHNHWCDEEGCNKVYTNRRALGQHKRLKHGERANMYACDHPGCDKVFTSQFSLDRHKGKHMKITQRIFPCEECDRVYNNISSLRSHVLLKHKPDVECPECHQFFDSKNIYRHRKTQHNFKYPCDKCNERFEGYSDLIKHKKQEHREHKICPWCHMNLVNMKYSRYVEHLKTHTDEKPFQCPKCGTRFQKPANLTRHERTCRGIGRRFA